MSEEEQQQSPLTKYKLEQLEIEMKELHREIDRMKKEANARERKLLRAGLSALGSVVLLFGTVIWNYRSVIFKG